jgi:acyl dehydratase
VEEKIPADKLLDHVGECVGTSDWVAFTQDEINAFGVATRDPDPMHMDPKWASSHSPYGQTIAFGFQTLSMLTFFSHEIIGWSETTTADSGGYALNYGFNKVRFVGPVPVDTPCRCRLTLADVEDRGPGQKLLIWHAEVEVKGADRPALFAEWLGLWVTSQGHEIIRSADGLA